jgi:8-oxo-dGTP pyrophosphatase MutT (NUDIX family)
MNSPYESFPSLSKRELAAVPLKVDKYYPPNDARLKMTSRQWRDGLSSDILVIPEGPWSITDHPTRQRADRPISPIYTEDNPVPEYLVEQWRAVGLKVDTVGRPLFPRAKQVLAGPGMFTQPGAFYGYGPQRIVNCSLRRVLRSGAAEYATVWVERDGALCGGLPGGHAEPAETILEAGLREFHEEAGPELTLLVLVGDIAIRETVAPPHPHWKTTLHAWMEEHFIFISASEALADLELRTNDPGEVVATQWMSVDDIQHDGGFMSTHRKQVEANEHFVAGA